MRLVSSSHESSGHHIVGKYLSSIIVFVSVTALTLLGFLISHGNNPGSIRAATGSSAYSSWIILIAGLAVASALAVYLILTTRRRLIEEQLRTDRAKLENLVVSAHRIETMAQLAGSIAHDFNNVLMTVSGYASLALTKSEETNDPEMQEYLNLVNLSADNGTHMIKKLLSFSRGKSQRRGSSTDLLPAVQNTADLLKQLLPDNIALQVEIAEKLPILKIDSLTLEQIVTNLVINASEAIKGSGTIRINLMPITVNQTRCNACQKMFAGKFVRLAVSDNGKGLTLENMDDIFQPFYTTKKPATGGGLGLALLQNLVHEIGGHIELSSTPDNGTAVAVFLPLS
jgi:signal transduction histidine kinase